MQPEPDVPHRRALHESLQEYGRGIAGGLLFSLPLLYTMEVWWHGFTAPPELLLIYLVITFGLLLGYNRYSGMHHDARFHEVAIDSVEEMGLGLLLAAGILYLLGQIEPGMSFDEILGKIVVEAMTIAIGISVGTAQLGSQESSPNSRSAMHGAREPQEANRPAGRPDAWGQLILGFCGAILFAANVAPTEEIVVIAFKASSGRLLGVSLLSLTLCALVLFYSDFVASKRHVQAEGTFRIAYGVVVSYALALTAAALMLGFFGRFAGQAWGIMLAETVVLAFPASLGASAGRLLIQ